jgi:TRAP-type C4-dicarboxylate transport system substrate-binding protein
MVEEATGGRLILDTKVMMVPHAEITYAVMDRRADIGVEWTPFVGGTFPLWDFGALPFFFRNWPWEYERAINDPRLIRILEESYREVGLIRLNSLISGPVDAVFSHKPIRTVDDFKGVKIRVIGLLPTMTAKLLGASPLVMPLGEVPDAMRLGMVDAVSAGVTFGLGTLGMADVSTYMSYWGIQPVYGGALIVNQQSWDALPADLQQILREVAREYQDQHFLASYMHHTTSMIDVLHTGLIVITPHEAEIERAVALTTPVIDKWLEIAGPHGPEVLAIISEYATGARR